MTALRLAVGPLMQQLGGEFNPVDDIGWHSLWYASGPNMLAQGYSNNDTLTTWPNETTEHDIDDTITGTPKYITSSLINGQPAVRFDGSSSMINSDTDWDSPLTGTYSIVVIAQLSASADIATDIVRLFAGREGANTTPRLYSWPSSPPKWAIYNGSQQVGSISSDRTAHMFVMVMTQDATADVLTVDGATAVNANAGTGGIEKMEIGQASSAAMFGDISLIGIYDGDVRDDPRFADLGAWVTSTYGGVGPWTYTSRFSDDFNRSNRALDGDNDWTEVNTGAFNIDITSNQLVLERTGSGLGIAVYNDTAGDIDNANQYAQVDVVDGTDDPFAADIQVGLYVRYTDASNYYWARYVPVTNDWRIDKRVGGTETNLLSISYASTLAYPFTIRFGVAGSQLRLELDTGSGFTLLGSVTDSSHSSGKTGIFAYGAVTDFVTVDDFVAGDVT